MTSPDPETQEDSGSITSVLKALNRVANDDRAFIRAVDEERILLLGRPRTLAKWDVRWLRQSGFELTLVDQPDNALKSAEVLKPRLIVAEAAFRNADGEPVYAGLIEAMSGEIPVLVLAGSASETTLAMDYGAYDVVRKPYDWRLISRRVRHAAQRSRQQAELDRARESLRSAVDLASQVRRQKQASESFEPVTGLPNRRKFEDLLRQTARTVEASGNVVLAMVIGLNRFNLISEALGIAKSNEVAARAAAMLTESLQSAVDLAPLKRGLRTASVARVGPGRFALMLTAAEGGDEVHHLRRVVIDKLSAPMQLDGQTLYLSPCGGAAVFPSEVADPAQLLLKAESAMREARARGVQFCHHSKDVDAEIGRRLEIENRLHAAVDRGELKLAYQPLVDISTDRIIGCEALLRWPQADGSFLSPSEFVPIAESSGLMTQIGEFVLRQACEQLADWDARGLGSLRMSVNVSKCQLTSDTFPELVKDCLDEYGIDASRLDLELSERGTLTPADDIQGRLQRLKALGVSLSIDDFGTGEAAIAYLKDLPVDVLKIDRSYVMELKSDGAESAITSAIVALGQKLNLTVVAEGVESDEQLVALRGMGCDQYQGFYRSPAVDPDTFAGMLDPAA